LSTTDNDHAIPVKVIIKMLMDKPSLSEKVIIEILRQFYVSVTVTKYEHTVLLKNLGLASKMPNDWNGIDPLARYKKAGIQVIETT